MNIYYAPRSQIRQGYAELIGQEAKHASKVMRASTGDKLTVVDGAGGRYQGLVAQVADDYLQLKIEEAEQVEPPSPELILGMGIIKKRDRLEFAVEKAVELGASGIALFRSERTVKQNVRMDRLEAKVLSAMKQSLRAWLPAVRLFDSPVQVTNHYSAADILTAHEKVGGQPVVASSLAEGKTLLMVGPEGGFSESEIEEMKEREAQIVSLGQHRLRAETAAVAFLSRFLK